MDVWIDSDGTADDIVTDVQINGTSIVIDGVANVPVANSNGDMGVVTADGAHGILAINGALGARMAGYNTIKKGEDFTSSILTPGWQAVSVFYGLAKIAGHDEKDSTLPSGTYTPEAKAAIAEMLGLPYERLIYKDDTFGNVWDEYQPISVDLDNNAIILDDATGIPTDEITPIYSANLVYKPLLNLQYGNLPKELISSGVSRIKNIGDNKIQFFDNSGNIKQFTDTTCFDMTKCRLLFKANKNIIPSLPRVDNLLPNHKYHIRFKYYGHLPTASGITINKGGYGTGYGEANAHKRTGAIIVYSKGTMVYADYDSYASVVGGRGLSYPTGSLVDYTYGEFNLWVEPDSLLNGVRYYAEAITMAADTSKTTNWMRPCISFGRGFIDLPMTSVLLSKNNVNECFSNGCVFEVFDCGTHF